MNGLLNLKLLAPLSNGASIYKNLLTGQYTAQRPGSCSITSNSAKTVVRCALMYGFTPKMEYRYQVLLGLAQ